jgi:hypothetical protein
VAPQLDESPDGSASPAKVLDLTVGVIALRAGLADALDLIHQPLHEHAGFRVPQAARQGLIVENMAQQLFGAHQLIPCRPDSIRGRTP